MAFNFKVRKLNNDEVEAFQEIIWKNDMYLAQTIELLSFVLGNKPAELYCAILESGKIIGTCCRIVYEERAILSAIETVGVDVQNQSKVCRRMIEFACDSLPRSCRLIELVIRSSIYLRIPRSLSIFQTTRYWRIQLYSAPVDKIIVNMSSDSQYKILPIEREKYTVSANYISSSGENKALIIESPKRLSYYAYNLCLEGVTVGYGVVFKVNDDKWVIGPLVAHNEDGALTLFNSIFLDMKLKNIEGRLFIYSLHESVRNMLEKIGFEKSHNNWLKHKFYHSDPQDVVEPDNDSDKCIHFAINSLSSFSMT